jgi:hypothetical protein
MKMANEENTCESYLEKYSMKMSVSASVKENESAETQPRKSVKINGEEKKQWRSSRRNIEEIEMSEMKKISKRMKIEARRSVKISESEEKLLKSEENIVRRGNGIENNGYQRRSGGGAGARRGGA